MPQRFVPVVSWLIALALLLGTVWPAHAANPDDLIAQAAQFYWQGKHAQAIVGADDARTMYARAKNRTGEAHALLLMGESYALLGRNDAARKAYDEARSLYHAEGHRLGEAYVLRGLGHLECTLGRNEAARRTYDEARLLYQTVGDRLGEAHVLLGLGRLESALGRSEAARKAYDEARPLYQAVGDQLGEANVLRSLGDLERELGRNEAARQAYAEARPLYQAEGNRLGEASVLLGLGHLGHAPARRAYAEARLLYEAEGHRLGEANVLTSLGQLERILGRNEAARKAYDDARTLFQAVGHRLGEANVLRGLGDLERTLGRNEAARKAYDDARIWYRAVGNRLGEANVLFGLGHLARTAGDEVAARNLFRDAAIEYGMTGLLDDQRRAQVLAQGVPDEPTRKEAEWRVMNSSMIGLLSGLGLLALALAAVALWLKKRALLRQLQADAGAASLSHVSEGWYAAPDAEVAVVLVHGILSGPASCWRSTQGAFWPDLIRDDPRMQRAGIYLADYYAQADAGEYGVDNAARDVFAALSNRQDTQGHAGPLAKEVIVFVAHSTGGLVVRQMLVSQRERFAGKTVGLLLLASPSRGSEWANRLELVRRLAGNRMLRQLQRGNDFLKDLDNQFADLVSSNTVQLSGLDAFENSSVVLNLPWPHTQIVEAGVSAAYFGATRIVAGTNHFTIAKPTSREHPSHKLLWEFLQRPEFGLAATQQG